jgi:16S rRNA (cytidine1402-2'-O)-methyltransferase
VTKLHEEFLRGRASEILETLKSRDGVKGEITLLIGKAEEEEVRVSTGNLARRLAQIMAEEKLDEKAALKKLAKERGISKSEAYREWQRSK